MSKLEKLGKGVHLSVTKAGPKRYKATLRFNGSDAGDGISVMGFSWHSLTHAMHRAAALAHSVLSNPIVESLLPPGAGTAIQVVSKLTDMAQSGKLQQVAKDAVTGELKPLWQHFSDPVLRDVAGKLAAAADGAPAAEAAMSGRPITLIGCPAQNAPMGFRRGIRRGPQFGPPRGYRYPTFNDAYNEVYGPQPGWVAWDAWLR
jgi:hypothetical protein